MTLDAVPYPENFSPEEGCALQVTIRVAPGDVDAWFSAFRPVWEACVAEEECTFWEMYRDPDDPGLLTWIEHW